MAGACSSWTSRAAGARRGRSTTRPPAPSSEGTVWPRGSSGRRPLGGRTTRETVEAIQAAEGGETDVLAIGPAGEHRVRFACLTHYWKNREGVAGRGGLGAVCGAKNLKALCATGSRKTVAADPGR